MRSRFPRRSGVRWTGGRRKRRADNHGRRRGGRVRAGEPILEVYARAVRRLGPAGAGQLTKMVNQICIAGVLQGLSEGLAFAERAGLDGTQVIDVISKALPSPGRWRIAERR